MCVCAWGVRVYVSFIYKHEKNMRMRIILRIYRNYHPYSYNYFTVIVIIIAVILIIIVNTIIAVFSYPRQVHCNDVVGPSVCAHKAFYDYPKRES